jgi:hypothetical protein
MALYQDLVDAGVVYPGTDPKEFAAVLLTLISGGFVKL